MWHSGDMERVVRVVHVGAAAGIYLVTTGDGAQPSVVGPGAVSTSSSSASSSSTVPRPAPAGPLARPPAGVVSGKRPFQQMSAPWASGAGGGGPAGVAGPFSGLGGVFPVTTGTGGAGTSGGTPSFMATMMPGGGGGAGAGGAAPLGVPASTVRAAARGGLSVVSSAPAAFDWGRFVDAVAFLFTSVSALQEFDTEEASSLVTVSLIRAATERLWVSVRESEQGFLKV